MSEQTFTKRVVITTDLEEGDIRPPGLMSELKRLSIHDAAEYFSDRSKLVEVACPACASPQSTAAFSHYDFLYRECEACASLFVSPRPSAENLTKYYATSSASRFRVQHFSRDTAQARRFHLLRSHADWMGQLIDEIGNTGTHSYADFETYSPRIFDEVYRLELFDSLFTINPLSSIEGETDAPVQRASAGQTETFSAISAFEKIEHQFSPNDFLRRIRALLAPGGLFFFTTRTIDGFDLQVLWDKAPYIFVPEHMNLLSIDGIRDLLQRSGFEMVELSTPGQLDLQLVEHASREDPSIQLPRTVRYLLDKRDKLAHRDFQAFLQKHRLSSHVRVAARKAEASE